jgi:hypothetical protein
MDMFFKRDNKKLIARYCVKIVEECHGVTLQNAAKRKGNILKSIFIDGGIQYTWNPGSVVTCFRKNLQENIDFLVENELIEGYAENKSIIIGFLNSILDVLPQPTENTAVLCEQCIIADALYWTQPMPGYNTCGQKKYIQKFNEYLERTH